LQHNRHKADIFGTAAKRLLSGVGRTHFSSAISVQRVVSAATLELFARSARARVVTSDLFGPTGVDSICPGPMRDCASMRSEVAIDVDKPGGHVGNQFLTPLLIHRFLVRSHRGINVMLIGDLQSGGDYVSKVTYPKLIFATSSTQSSGRS